MEIPLRYSVASAGSRRPAAPSQGKRPHLQPRRAAAPGQRERSARPREMAVCRLKPGVSIESGIQTELLDRRSAVQITESRYRPRLGVAGPAAPPQVRAVLQPTSALSTSLPHR